MIYILAAVRFAAFVVTTLALYTAWTIGNLLIPNKIFWRQIIFGAWAKAFIFISGMKVSVIGTPPKAPFLLVSNHLSYTDIPLLRYVTETVFVAKGEIEGWFLAGRIVRDMGNIFINRQNRRDIPRAGKKILEHLDDGEGVAVFPEGTSTKGERVLKFNSSFLEFAARVDLPVHYVALSYRTAQNLPPANTVCWWLEDETFAAHLWKVFQITAFEAVVVFGEAPIADPDRKKLAVALHEKVSEKFIPVL